MVHGRHLGVIAGAALGLLFAAACRRSPATEKSPGESHAASRREDGGAVEHVERAESSPPGVFSAGVRWVGRVDLTDPEAPRFAWSGSGFVATVSGSAISVRLRTDRTDGGATPIFFQPVVDGRPGPRFAVPAGELVVRLAAGLADGDHRVEVYRETEGRYPSSVFAGFTEGTPRPPPPYPGRLVEIVGDSISAGYGDLGTERHPNSGPDPDGGCPFTTATESAYATYGAIAARALGADWSIVAVSGFGVYRDNGNSTANVVPAFYDDALGTRPAPSWRAGPEPQAVVVNLGSNDFFTGDPGQARFEKALSAFVARVRARHPDAWIVCTVGPLLYGTGLTAALADTRAVVADLRARGDLRVSFLEFPQQDSAKGTGCQYHPDVAEQEAMAAILVPALRAALGW